MLSFAGTVLFLISLVLAAAQGVARIVAPDSAPRGVATVVILVLLFGSLNLFAIGLVGEYLARVFEEVKRRPLYVRCEHRARRRGAPGLAVGGRALGVAARMIAMEPRRSSRAPAPCAARPAGASSRRRASTPARSTSTRSPRASSPSTCTTASSSARPATPSTPARCSTSAASTRPTTRRRSTARRRRRSRAAPTPASCARCCRACRAPARRSTSAPGEGSFLEELLDLGFDRVCGYEPSAAPLAAASERVRALIVHDVFDARRARPGAARTT